MMLPWPSHFIFLLGIEGDYKSCLSRWGPVTSSMECSNLPLFPPSKVTLDATLDNRDLSWKEPHRRICPPDPKRKSSDFAQVTNSFVILGCCYGVKTLSHSTY